MPPISLSGKASRSARAYPRQGKGPDDEWAPAWLRSLTGPSRLPRLRQERVQSCSKFKTPAELNAMQCTLPTTRGLESHPVIGGTVHASLGSHLSSVSTPSPKSDPSPRLTPSRSLPFFLRLAAATPIPACLILDP